MLSFWYRESNFPGRVELLEVINSFNEYDIANKALVTIRNEKRAPKASPKELKFTYNKYKKSVSNYIIEIN